MPVSQRTTTSPGSFTVNADGILEFPTIEDFHQTVDYITTDTIQIQLNSFRASFSIKTLNKQADIIIDSIDNVLYYPSKVSIYWPNYSQCVDLIIQSGDTVVTKKFGAWGEFLNLQNLVVIEGSLYKITKEKTILILDGDLGKLDDAEELEESDTTEGIFITPRACACDPTGFEWKFERTVYQYYSGNNHRITSTEIFSNMTLWKVVAGGVKIRPHFVHETTIKIEKRGIIGWFCHRMHFNWNRQVWVSHNLQIPSASQNYYSANLWYESTGWNNHYECLFEYRQDYIYDSFITNRTWDMQAGYCLAVKIFSQNITTNDNPIMHNGWYFYPYPVFDCSSYHENNCDNFDWMYGL